MGAHRFCFGPATFLIATNAAAGGINGADLDEVSITARCIVLSGAPRAASEGTVLAEPLQNRPLLRVGALLEVVPGRVSRRTLAMAKPTSAFCVASTSTTAPISRPASTACPSTCPRTATARATWI